MDHQPDWGLPALTLPGAWSNGIRTTPESLGALDAVELGPVWAPGSDPWDVSLTSLAWAVAWLQGSHRAMPWGLGRRRQQGTSLPPMTPILPPAASLTPPPPSPHRVQAHGLRLRNGLRLLGHSHRLHLPLPVRRHRLDGRTLLQDRPGVMPSPSLGHRRAPPGLLPLPWALAQNHAGPLVPSAINKLGSGSADASLAQFFP